MKALIAKSIILLVAATCILAAGCNEQQAPSEKQARLIAAENKKLIEQLDIQGRQMVELKAEHAREIEDQKKLLDACNAERDALKEQVKGQIENNVQGVLGSVMDQNAQLRQQVEQLQAELNALKNKPDTQ